MKLKNIFILFVCAGFLNLPIFSGEYVDTGFTTPSGEPIIHYVETPSGGESGNDGGGGSGSGNDNGSGNSSENHSGSGSGNNNQNTDITLAVKSLSEKAEAFSEEAALLPDSAPDTELIESGIQDIVDAEASLTALEQECQAQETENAAEIQNEEKTENSADAGDPVLIATGEYIEKDIDFSLKGGFQINRVYRSRNNITGSFGYGWSSVLDERLVFGVENGLQEKLGECKNVINILKTKKAEIEKNIKEKYSVSSIDNAKKEIEEKIENVKEILQKGKIAYEDTLILEEKYKISGLKEKTEQYIKKLEILLADYEKFQISLENEINFYRSISEKINAEEIHKNQLEQKISQSENVIQKSLFYGTPSYWINCGSDGITFVDENCIPHTFKKTENSEWFPVSKINKKYLHVKKNGEENYVLTCSDGRKKYFSKNGLITKIEDRNDNVTFINRNVNGKILSVKNSFNQEYEFVYKGNFITIIKNIKDSNEKKKYDYEKYLLVSLKDEDDDTVIYDYDLKKCISRIVKSDGSFISFLKEEEDNNGNLLITGTVNEEGYREYFSFDNRNNSTIYIDADGNKTIYKYDSNLQTVYSKGPENGLKENEVIKIYDNLGNETKTIINGDETVCFYDDKGNCIRKKYSDGSSEYFSYGIFNFISSYTDRDGVVFKFSYDNKGNLLSAKKAGELIFEQEFDSRGLVINKTVAGNPSVSTDYKFDENGNLINKQCGTYIETYEYDERNRVKKILINNNEYLNVNYFPRRRLVHYASGLLEESIYNERKDLVSVIKTDEKTGETRKLEYEYDKRHLPVKKFCFNENEKILCSEYEYSPNGKLISEKTYDIPGNDYWLSQYEYTGNYLSVIQNSRSTIPDKVNTVKINNAVQYGNIITRTIIDGDGNQSQFNYDSSGYLTAFIDSMSQKYVFENTSGGKTLKSPSPFNGYYFNNYEINGELSNCFEEGNKKNKYTWYPNGNLKSYENTKGEITQYFYNNQGYLSEERESAGSVFYQYDDEGVLVCKIIGETNSEENAEYIEKYFWSRDKREVLVTQGDSIFTTYFYNGFGDLVGICDGEGNLKSYFYDYQGRLSEEKDAYGFVTKYKYDGKGNLSEIHYADGSWIYYDYDINGNCIKKTDCLGTLWSGVYDFSGNLTQEKQRGDIERTYKYDGNSRILEIKEENEIVQTYDYKNYGRTVEVKDACDGKYLYEKDGFGRITSETNRLGNVQYFQYDSEGNVSVKTDFIGNNSEHVQFRNGQINKAFYADGSFRTVLCDMHGNIVQAENDNSLLIYDYNQAGLLEMETDKISGETVQYSYDKTGRIKRIYGAGREIYYDYGKNGEILSIKDLCTGLSCSFKYDSLMREIYRVYGNGINQRTVYDEAGRVQAVIQKDSMGRVLWAEGYAYDKNGKINGKVNNLGFVTLFEYGNRGYLKKVSYPYSLDVREHIREEANDLGLEIDSVCDGQNINLNVSQFSCFSKLMELFYPGASGALCTVQSVIEEFYEYDKKGNRIFKETPYGKISYFYDEENNLKKICTGNCTVVEYEQDLNGNLISEKTLSCLTSFSYNAQNRMSSCSKTFQNSSVLHRKFYLYDPFSRRVGIKESFENESAARRILYDGFSFNMLKESSVTDNGLFTDSYVSRKTNGYSTSGERYRFAYEKETEDIEIKTKNNSIFAVEGIERYPLYAGDRVFAYHESGNNLYLGTDILCNSVNMTDDFGHIKKQMSYDVFGTPVNSFSEQNLVFGYNGKPIDSINGFYDYGYRHYEPSSGRFTTIDPIRDGINWFSYVTGDPVNFVDLWGLFYYSEEGQQSITTVKKTTVVILRNNDGLGNEFDSARLIYKNDGFTTKLAYVDSVGANCRDIYDGTKGSTTPDGKYYLSNKILTKQADGTYDSLHYDNVLSLMTNDTSLSSDQRSEINIGDRLFHTNQFKGEDKAYNSTNTPGSAGCIIDKGQEHHNEMMSVLMDGVVNPETITVYIRSMNNLASKENIVLGSENEQIKNY